MNCRSLALLIVVVLAMVAELATAQAPASAPLPEAPPVKAEESLPEIPNLSNDQLRELIRQAAEKDIQNDKAQRDYTYIQHEAEHKLNGRGGVQSTELRTYEIMVLYGEQTRKLVAKNDQPLTEKEAAKEEAKIQKLIDKRKNESEDERRKRLEKEEKQREDDRQFVREVADAYNFRLAGMEMLEGRDTYVIDADPRPGFEPHRREARILPKFRFRVWIDKTETQWVRLDIQCIDTVAIGWILARVHKGSNIGIEQTRVNDEVWLPKHVALKLDARVALLKGLNIEEDVTYSDYKKFRADTKIVPVAEAPEQH